jgi:cytochrome P450
MVTSDTTHTGQGQKPGGCPVLINDPELTADPYTELARIREESPVVRGQAADGRTVWIVTRYDDVNFVLTDRRFVSNSRSVPGSTIDEHARSLRWLGLPEELVPYLAAAITQLDPPDHTRLRKLVDGSFSARRMAELRPRVQALVDELVDALPGHAADGAVDLVEHFTYRLPVAVICEVIGVPAEDRGKWQEWSHGYTSALSLVQVLTQATRYVRDLIRQRKAEPADDLLTALIQAHNHDSDSLSETELVTMAFHLVVAGHETTSGLIGNGILALLTHPEQRALLHRDPGLMPGAVQELLRWRSPIVFGKPRYVTEDVEIAGVPMHAGDVLLPIQGAANHDPRHFTDPERLDITRHSDGAGVHHFAYSHGPHYCLGALLANQEAELALHTLFSRFPDMSLAVPEHDLVWRPVPGTRQLDQLPVILGKERATARQGA